MQKSTMLKKEEALKNRQWFIIDATNAIVGKIAVQIANLLRGKNKPNFTPNVDCGDYVIVYNTNKMVLTGNKLENEKWYSHSGYIGGLRTRTGKVMMNKYSDELLELAVRGMLPKNRLSRRIITKLHIFKNAVTKNYDAHKPISIKAEGVIK